MKSNYINKIVLTCFFALITLISCQNGNDGKKVTEYTCPMHPQIVRNEPGQCPICGMDLVLKEANNELVVDSGLRNITRPVNKNVLANVSVIKAESGKKVISTVLSGVINYDARNRSTLSSRVSGRIEKLNIKFNYQAVKKGELIMEIYSPELSAAQRELLLLVNNGDYTMFVQAKQRLLLLGMRESDINSIIYEKEILYRFPVYSNSDGYIVESLNNSPEIEQSSRETPTILREGQYVSAGQELFTIYKTGNVVAEIALPPDIARFVTKNQKILIQRDNEPDLQSATIDLIEPVLRNGTSYVVAKSYLNKKYAVGELVKVNIPIAYNGGWWIPSNAVVTLGAKSIVFRKEHDVFKPVSVNIGARVGDMVQVTTDISDLELASNAHYMVDSESFIK